MTRTAGEATAITRDEDPDCKFSAGFMVPVIDPMRCEAAGPCVPI